MRLAGRRVLRINRSRAWADSYPALSKLIATLDIAGVCPNPHTISSFVRSNNSHLIRNGKPNGLARFHDLHTAVIVARH